MEETYLRDIKGIGQHGIHRHHPKKGVWSIFQSLHPGQVVRQQQAGSEGDSGLSRTKAKFPSKDRVVPAPGTHSQLSLHHINADLQLGTVQALQDVLDVFCSQGGQATVPAQGRSPRHCPPSEPSSLTYKVLALLRVDPDDANLELRREVEREAGPRRTWQRGLNSHQHVIEDFLAGGTAHPITAAPETHSLAQPNPSPNPPQPWATLFWALPGLHHIHLQVFALHQPGAPRCCQPGR